ncbi:MAG TPA: phosphoribosylglycinamide formyltransferase [Polyangiaceae bacterium]|nr:phosphoribosylglycinamide formyltransferase [Polyangiaceae bacterium]
MTTLDLGILVSGTGTNLQAILDAVSEGRLDARVKLVISNKPGVRALERARQAGVPARVLPHADYPDRASYDRALIEALRAASADWIVLAGFMRVLSSEFVEHFAGRIVNIHPSLLPAFPGVRAQRQALEYGAKVTGCTVHFVDAGVDTGPIILQRAIEIHDDDDEARLSARLLEQEHQALVEALSRIAAGRVRLLPQATGRARVVQT